MAVVTKTDIKNALTELGIQKGDVMVVHSSLKSFGHVEGGADAVIDACLETLTPSGTLVFPTLIQKDFAYAYDTWHMDKPSDVGYITEVFRKREGVLRSDQATHSVAAAGRLADFLTREHGAYGKRIGSFGDTPFAVSSPWQKMYELGGKVLLIGVDMNKNTCKHLVEYKMLNELLARIKDEKLREELAGKLKYHAALKNPELNATLLWPYFDTLRLQQIADERGLIRKAQCGDAQLLAFDIRTTNDLAEKLILENPSDWFKPPMSTWLEDAIKAAAPV